MLKLILQNLGVIVSFLNILSIILVIENPIQHFRIHTVLH